ncbi:DUF5958 family protein [Streptomyces sp. NPDC053755]|uniref:DUF5958 family protein n=1 Tax=Streptomyces sp. NPDC053755 TaxID=3155815 RepID=UPI00341CC52A
MTERDVILNELAQGLRPMSQGIEWFDTHSPEEQAEILLFLRRVVGGGVEHRAQGLQGAIVLVAVELERTECHVGRFLRNTQNRTVLRVVRRALE